MAVRNSVQPHLIKHPCNTCRTPTLALVQGKVQDRPCCEQCSKRFAQEFKQALIQRNAQVRG